MRWSTLNFLQNPQVCLSKYWLSTTLLSEEGKSIPTNQPGTLVRSQAEKGKTGAGTKVLSKAVQGDQRRVF